MKTFIVLYKEHNPSFWRTENSYFPTLCFIQAKSREAAAERIKDFLENDPNGSWGYPDERHTNDRDKSITLVYEHCLFYIVPCPNIEDCHDGFDSFC